MEGKGGNRGGGGEGKTADLGCDSRGVGLGKKGKLLAERKIKVISASGNLGGDVRVGEGDTTPISGIHLLQ